MSPVGPTYSPPPASAALVKGVKFSTAHSVGKKYVDRFARWDALEDEKDESKQDKNNCKGLLQFPDNTLFWESKMALDTDGATNPVVIGGDKTHLQATSLKFADGKSIDAEFVPFFVVPTYDDPESEKPAFERSGDNFVKDFKLAHGTLGVVVFGGKRVGAIFADEGPPMKIGETSIRVHEALRKPPRPWADANKTKLIDSGEERGVLYFVFVGQVFDIEAYGSGKLAEMAKAIDQRACALFDSRFPTM
jgi:hypothetical protein